MGAVYNANDLSFLVENTLRWKHMLFQSIEDTPDVMLAKGQCIVIGYEYFWGNVLRKKSFQKLMALTMHAKDMFKLREKALRAAYSQNQTLLGGSPPRLFGLQLELVTS